MQFYSAFRALAIIVLLSFASAFAQYADSGNQPQFAPITVEGGFTLNKAHWSQLDILNMPVPIKSSSSAMLVLNYVPDINPYYLIIGAERTSNSSFTFVAQNLYIPSSMHSPGEQNIAIRFDLQPLGINDGSQWPISEPLRFYIHYGFAPSPIPHPDFIQLDLPVNYAVDDGENGYTDPTPLKEPPIEEPTPPPNSDSPVDTVYYYGCNVPNIDLDNSENGPSPTYAGDKNACGPTAASNSLKWLSDTFESIDIPISHRALLDSLSRYMQRPPGEGVSIETFLKGKLDLINALGLQINVKFQSESDTNNVSSSDGTTEAANQNDGPYPTWEFIKEQMADSEDVEILYKWPDGNGGWRGHVVVLTGAMETADGKKSIRFKHDINQSDTGGTVQEAADVTVDHHGRVIIHRHGMKRYVAHVVAESPGPPIPVELTSYSLAIAQNSVNLYWGTATEMNNYGFEIYRNGEFLDFINGGGTTTIPQEYSYHDANLLSGRYAYQLIQIDYDGSRENLGAIYANISMPSEYSLAQNYPNPFNPNTIIDFSIPQDQSVTINLFNSLGEEVSIITSEHYKAGSHSVEINAARLGLSSGVYYYRMQSGDFAAFKKMVILK